MTDRADSHRAEAELLRTPPGAARPPCIFAEATGKCCSRRVRCHHPRQEAPGGAGLPPEHSGRPCRTCPDRRERMHIGAVITARNEGAEVRKTVQNLAASVLNSDLTVILVDDGSKDENCTDHSAWKLNGARLQVVRHAESLGVGRSRNAGSALARDLGCNVVSFHDAHMRFTWPGTQGPGGLERLARKALRGPVPGPLRRSGASADAGRPGGLCIICAGSNGYKVERGRDRAAGNRLFCCDLLYNAAYGLQPKWRIVGKAPPHEWEPSPCPMGAGYVMSASTCSALEAATACPEQGRAGQLWEDTAGRWGFSEEALAVKAHLLDVPVLFSRDVVFRHLYRGANPLPRADRERWRNVTRATALLLGRELFETRFRGLCEKKLGAAEVERITGPALDGEPAIRRCAVRSPESVFSQLCGSKGDQEEAAQKPSASARSPKDTARREPAREEPPAPLVTVCLLSYRRRENLPAVLACLARQTVLVEVVLWNNRPPLDPAQRPGVRRVVQSSENLGCFPRWQMAALARTEFVCSLDDDLALADERVLEDAVAACREECPDGIVGFFGWSEAPGRDYRHGRHHNGARRGARCDVVKGRFMLMRRALLARVPMALPAWDVPGGDTSAEAPLLRDEPGGFTEPLGFRCDDIYVSLCISGGRPGHHLVPGRLGRRWRELPRRGVGLDTDPAHYRRRDRALRVIKRWLQERT
jgi:GT2 family glycosyltransferase